MEHRAARSRLAALCTAALALTLSLRAAGALASGSPASTPPSGGEVVPTGTYSALIYDRDYPFINYSGPATHNDVSRLQEEMESGKMTLEFRAPRGYLDSLLKALKISPTSQTLVFSKTSLQTQLISPASPRAIYFNDDTYVAWVRDTAQIEINTMDSALGPVFYTLDERTDVPARLHRESLRCLACHDTYSLQGGGVPNFLFLSAYEIENGEVLTNGVASETTDATPLADRWGGWYVTGKFGGLLQLGNVLPSSNDRPIPLATVSREDVANLDQFFDTQPYLTDKSDVVAVLVFQSQVDIHNLIIHANYKSRMLLERESPGSSTRGLTFEQLPPITQKRFETLLEPLVRGMLFVDAPKFPTPLQGDSGYAKWFQAQGPFDRQGRSLRDFDLDTRLFKYPLSFLIYSKGFDYLVPSCKEYVYRRLIQILTGRDTTPAFSRLSAGDRRAILEILTATKPDFARAVAKARAAGFPALSVG
ncbi:MAG: hypothetical protein WBE92_18230 [Steroidobacteraceae bacterium]